MRDQGVLGMHLEPIVRQFLGSGFFVEDFDIKPFASRCVGSGNSTVEGGPDAIPLALRPIYRNQVIAFEPKPRVRPKW
jgi:hypothetical protein